MKLVYLFGLTLIISASCASMKAIEINDTIVDASCGICQLDMTGESCDLAIVYNNKKYYVVGSQIDEHGDAHAEDGLCNSIRKAKVNGTIKNGVFEASSFELLKD